MNEITLPYKFPIWERWYQVQVFDDQRKNKVLVIHRRAGKSTLAINYLIYQAARPENAGKIFHYLFPQKSQAKEVIWKNPDMLFRFLPEMLIEKKNEVELTIFLTNKSQIYIKGADDPDTLRGTNAFGVILDEYAQMKPEVYTEIYRPILAANKGWIWFLGTPKGKNDFYRKKVYAENNPETWQVLELKASTSGIIAENELLKAKAEMPEHTFNQEFECEFIEGNGTIFRRIRDNVKNKFQPPEPGKEYKIGLDLAKYEDFTVVTVVDKSTWEVVYIERFNQIDYNLQQSKIEAISLRYNKASITIDRSSIGDPIAEDLRRLGLHVDDFVFTNESKKNLIENLVLLLEQDQISLPDYEPLIRELEDYSYTLSALGRVIYNAPDGQHDDCVISLALAFWKIGVKIQNDHNIPKNYGFQQNIRIGQGGGYSKQILRR